jgi:hypothetical protein
MTKIDLSNCTFLIPIRVESADRMRNIITSICYILRNFDTHIIVKEIDATSIFSNNVLPQIQEYFETDQLNLTHIFEKSDDKVFHRMRSINEMIDYSNTDVVVNYDCDVLLPINSYVQSFNMISNSDSDVVYPYGEGTYQVKVYADDQIVSNFLNDDFDFNILEKKSSMEICDYGFCQFFKKSSYIEGGMENENFLAYGPEDKERFYRFTKLGFKVSRVLSKIYHLEHSRTFNSSSDNPNFKGNWNLWHNIQKMSEDELRYYYKNQNYLKKYTN